MASESCPLCDGKHDVLDLSACRNELAKQRSVLLEALRGTLNWLTSYPGHGADIAYKRARTAIALCQPKAKGAEHE